MTISALVALDQGTSTTRAALFRNGRLVVEARRKVRLIFPSPGRAEQDARELHETALSALEEVVAKLEPGEAAVLGITNQRSTVVLWDAETGRPLGPALSWRDSRAQAESDALEQADSDLLVRTGLPPSPHYGAPKIVWALESWPEARAAADRGRLRVGPVSTWLAWKLSRGEAFTVDPTNAQRMHLLDLRTLEWHPELVHACSLPDDALPNVLPTDGYFGEAQVGSHSLPIRAMMGDQQAALIGLRTQGSDPVAGVQLGTGGFVLRDVGGEYRRVPGLLGGLARADANQPRRYLVEGPVNSAGSAFDRLRDLGLLRKGESLDEAWKNAVRPLTVVPAWAGLAAPWWEARARAMVLGWDESTTRADVVAGTVRGLAFLIADIVDRMRENELEVSRLELSGPLSAAACVASSIADATGLLTRVRSNPEASLEGIIPVAGTLHQGHEAALERTQPQPAPPEESDPGGHARIRVEPVVERARPEVRADPIEPVPAPAHARVTLAPVALGTEARTVVCLFCDGRVRVQGSGRWICPSCGALFSVTDEGGVAFDWSRADSEAVHVTLDVSPRTLAAFAGTMEGMLTGRRVSHARMRRFAREAAHVCNLVAENAWPAGRRGPLHVLALGGPQRLHVRIVDRGRALGDEATAVFATQARLFLDFRYTSPIEGVNVTEFAFAYEGSGVFVA